MNTCPECGERLTLLPCPCVAERAEDCELCYGEGEYLVCVECEAVEYA